MQSRCLLTVVAFVLAVLVAVPAGAVEPVGGVTIPSSAAPTSDAPAGRSSRGRAPPGSGASKEPTPAEVDVLRWSEIWSIPFPVGKTSAERRGQIALRGPLVVAAGGGAGPEGSGEGPGAFVVDGRSDWQRRDAKVAQLDRLVRRIPVPGSGVVGLVLDDDYISVVSAEGKVLRARLDGLVAWTVDAREASVGPPALADLNADGLSDVLLPIAKVGTQSFGLLALEARTGRTMWEGSAPTGGDGANRLPPTTNALPRLSLQMGPGVAALTATVTERDVVRFAASMSAEQGVRVQGTSGQRPGGIPESFSARWYTAAGIIPPAVNEEEILCGLWFADPWKSAVWLVESAARQTCELWVTTADLAETHRRMSWSGPCGALTSVGNLNGDELWDIVLVADGKLRALSTDIRADVALPLPKGDLRASGVLPATRQSIRSYSNSLNVRDVNWWLRAESSSDEQTLRYARLSEPTPELEGVDGAARFVPDPSSGSLPPEPNTFDARAHAELEGRRAGIDRSGVRVCWLNETCETAPSLSDLTLMHLAFEPETERLWGLAKNGQILSIEPGANAWANAREPSNEGGGDGFDFPAIDGALRLRAFSDTLVILRANDFVMLHVDGPTAQAPHVTVPLTIRDIVRCDGGWYANNEGRLITPDPVDLGRWASVPSQPGPLRTLGCTDDGHALLATAAGAQYAEISIQSGPPELPRYTWHVLGVAAAALILFVLLPKRIGDKVKPAFVDQRFGSDTPIRRLEQTLGDHRVLVEALLDFVDNPGTRPPMTVAVCGAWGTGKSSVMSAFHDELHKTGRYLLVWFNAWRFHREPEITHAFYQTILDQFRAQATWSVKLRVLINRTRRAGVAGVTTFVVSSTLALMATIFIGMIIYGAIRTNAESASSLLAIIPTAVAVLAGVWQKGINPILKVVNLDTGKVLDRLQGRVHFVRDLKSEFDTVFAGVNGALKLVVCVDDLDRCPPARVADMLEALNALSDTGHTVLMLAIDPSSVARAVHVHFQDMIRVMRRQGADKEAASFGARYLEKMLTVSVNVPTLPAGAVMGRAATSGAGELGKEQPPLWKNWRFIRARVLRRVPLALTLAAALVALWPLKRLPLEWSPQAADKVSRQLYAWFLHVITPPAAPGSVSALPQTTPPEAADKRDRIGAVQPQAQPNTAARNPQPAANIGRTSIALPSQGPPLDTRPLEPPKVADVGESSAAGELRRLLLGTLAVCSSLLVLGGFARVVTRRAEKSPGRPATRDPDDFRAALLEASSRLPAHPRTAIRFENHARFVYHLVRRSEQWTSGCERHFFAHLIYRTFGHDKPLGVPDWLQNSIDAWSARLAPAESPAGSERGHDSGVRAAAAPPAA